MNTLSERERKGSRIHDALRRLGLSSNYQGYAQMVCALQLVKEEPGRLLF